MIAPGIKSIWWGRSTHADGVIAIEDPISADRAIEVLRRRKDDLWHDIQSSMKAFPDVKGWGEGWQNQVVTGYVNEYAALRWALEQLDIRADV